MSAGPNEAKIEAPETKAGEHLLDAWLDIEESHTDPGTILPDRTSVVDWCENHPWPVLAVASVAYLAPLMALLLGH